MVGCADGLLVFMGFRLSKQKEVVQQGSNTNNHKGRKQARRSAGMSGGCVSLDNPVDNRNSEFLPMSPH